jgi:signal transduction histidine kinase
MDMMEIARREALMIMPPIPANEEERLAAVQRYGLAEDGREPAFDHVTETAARLFGVPTSLVSIVTEDKQSFRGACGISISDTPRDIAFCAFAINQTDVFVVEDAGQDPRFRDNPLVTGDLHVRFYAGAPLIIGTGHAVGTLCLMDSAPRRFSEAERRRLADFGRIVSDMMELRLGSLAAAEREAALAEKTELLDLTVENVRQGIALFDADLRLNLCNDAFAELFDYPPGYVQPGDHAFDLMKYVAERGDLGLGDPDEIVHALIRSILGAESRRIEVIRVNGRHLDICRNTIKGGRFILTVADVTEERQLSQMKDDFVATVSHELRTPLTAIGGSIGLLAAGAGGELPPRAAHLVELARKNSERLARLVDDLLDIEKLESGRADFHFRPLDLADLLKAACEQNMPYAERFHVQLDLDTAPGHFLISGDPDRLLQVMTNLLSNGVKFSPPGSPVRIALSRHDGPSGPRARISVSDAGPGVPESFRPRLFKRFAQADSSSQRGQAGTGLGLAITKSLVERHGGEISLDPDSRAGATFHVDLPLLEGGGEA